MSERLGLFAAYVPLLFVVLLNTWFGGLWSSLLTQVVGGSVLFALLLQTSPATVSHSLLWSLLGFLGVAQLGSALILSLRYSEHLRHHTDQLEMIAQASHDCVWDWNVETGSVWRGGKLQELFGVSQPEIAPTLQWWRDRIDPREQKRVWDSLMSALAEGADRWAQEYRFRRSDGSWVAISDRARILRDRRRKAVRVLGGMADITAERVAEERLLHSTTHDALTGLPNRQAFLDRVRATGSDSARVAVLVIDIDRFKIVNDSYGHESGDQLLVAVGNRLRRLLREGDYAARLSSDAFAVSLESVSAPSEAMQVAQRLVTGLSLPFDLQEGRITLTASIGITYNFQTSPEGLLHSANLAMHHAKRLGRGQCQMFDPALEEMSRRQMERENELRLSLDDGSLRLHFQPIVSLQDGSVSDFESLLRWQHAVRGLVYPSEIFPVVENAGLSVQVGEWVFREACGQLKQWRQQFAGTDLSLNVNLSGPEFIRPTLVDEVKQVLREAAVPGESLVIEVTETIIMESNIDAARRLSQLRDMGIRLALDDFGKGHSSLGRLQDFPISILKIDSSFVRQIRHGKRPILDAIIALAHELDLEVTAEGVESREQLRYLKERDIAKVQGLLFAPALAREAAEAVIVSPPWDLEELLAPPPELSAGMVAG